jgi:ribosome biogenesis GTPase / thiamine phosphate phosphatase
MLDSIDLPALRRIGLSLPLMQQLQPLTPAPQQHLVRVIELQRDALTLHDGHAALPARTLPALTRELAARDETLAVGDWGLAAVNEHHEWWVQQRIDPVTQISRRVKDDQGLLRRQVLVSNVDTALLLMGLDHDFNLRRLERYLALVHSAGIAAVLLLTKADQCALRACAQRLAQAREVLPAEIPAITVDARAADTATLLAPWLDTGQTLVLAGSSGAGKSTLTNTLTCTPTPAALERAEQKVGASRADDGRGRHTTTARSMHFTAQGACVIDTPGMRSLRLDLNDEADLAAAFGDIGQHALHCRFRNCSHQDEPGCAVREAVEPQRLRNFHKLQREARRDAMTYLERRDELSRWKAIGRAGREGLLAKRRGA